MELASLKTIKCKIEAIYPSSNEYKIMIVSLDEGYIPITIPFNYNINLQCGSSGILTYEEALAGRTEWYDKVSERYYKHSYTAYYFKHFVPMDAVNNYENSKLTYN